MPEPHIGAGSSVPHEGRLCRLARALHKRLDGPAPPRPLWQRLVFPLLGVLCMMGAVVGALLPILPGWIFAVPGFLLLACIHPRSEEAVRRRLDAGIGRIVQRCQRKSDERAAVRSTVPEPPQQPPARHSSVSRF